MAMILVVPTFGRGIAEQGSDSTAAACTQVRLGALKGPTGIGMIHLFEEKTDLPPGTKLTVEAIGSIDTMVARLLSGELDAAVLPLNIATKLYNSGVDYRLLAVVGNGMVKMVSTDASIHSLSDLRGRIVHFAGQGATPEFLFRTIAKHEGLDPDKDLTMVFSMQPPEIAANMAVGRVEHAVLPEPFATLALRGNPSSREAFSLSGRWKTISGQESYPMSVLVAKGAYVDKCPDLLRSLMAAYQESIRSVLSDPIAAGLLVEKHDPGLKANIAAASIPSSAFVFIPAIEARTSVEVLLSIFLSLSPSSIGSKLPGEAFYVKLKR
jgi:NitT/TauT family transport system substrate-binding protein